MFRTLSAPVILQWEVTPDCNHACLHCYNYWRGFGEEPSAPEDVCEIYRATTKEIICNRVFSVVITGGEPLLVFDQVKPYIRQLVQAGVHVSLNTNLSLFDRQIAVELKELGVRSILTSLPSFDPETNDYITQTPGSHRRITRGIRTALESGFKVAVNMVVTKVNLSQVYQTAEYVANLGVKSFAATKAATPNNCPDFSAFALGLDEFRWMLYELIKAKERLGLESIDSLEFYPYCAFDEVTRAVFSSRMCSAGKTNCTIGFNGQVRPCSRAEHTYGDIREGLTNAWGRMTPWRTNEWLPEQCSTCQLKNKCGGGCKVDAQRTTGDIKQPDPICDFSQLPVRLPSVWEPSPDGTEFLVNPSMVFRPESFGGILYVSSGHWALVVQELYQLFASGKEVVSIEDIVSALGCSLNEATATVSYLVRKFILKVAKGGSYASGNCFVA